MKSHESSIGVEAQPELAAATRAGLVSLILLSCGHFSVDLYSSALGALQPLLMEKFHTSHLSLTLPFLLYGIFRYLYLVHQKEGGGSPAETLLNDRPLLVCVALWALAVALIIYGPLR